MSKKAQKPAVQQSASKKTAHPIVDAGRPNDTVMHGAYRQMASSTPTPGQYDEVVQSNGNRL